MKQKQRETSSLYWDGFSAINFGASPPISVQVVGEGGNVKRREVYVCGRRCEPISFMLGFGQYHQWQTTHLYCAPYRDLAQPLPFSKTKKQTFQWSFKHMAQGSQTVPNLVFLYIMERGGHPKIGWLNMWTLNTPQRRHSRCHFGGNKQQMNSVSRFAPLQAGENKRTHRILIEMLLIFLDFFFPSHFKNFPWFAHLSTHAAFIPKKKARTILNISFQLHFMAFINFPAVPLS